MYEINLSGYLETRYKKNLLVENGLGLGTKSIKTFLTPSVNGPGKEVGPFHKISPYYNFFSGFTFFPSERLNIKLNASSGVRVPNLAELSSNGLHEGVFTYEIGDPKMKNEQNFSFNFFLNYTRSKFELSISPFYNVFYNYVYLAPTNEDWFGFPVFRYKQQNVSQYGTEMTVTVKPSRSLTSSVSYSGMRSIMADGKYTPYTPPQRITPSVKYSFLKNKMKGLYLCANADYFLSQNEIAYAEIATPEYWLLNLSAGTTLNKKNQIFSFNATVNNLMNTAYYDHLSRFKYFGILNMGRNIVVSLKISFIKTGEKR
jgi:iron complex outermembrane receptor protein